MQLDLDENIVLICGCPRSGTYLLSKLLQENYDITIPTETHFIPHFGSYSGLWKEAERSGSKLSVKHAIADYLELWIRFGSGSHDLDAYRQMSLQPDLVALNDESACSISEVTCAAFHGYAKRFEGKKVADKSASYVPADLYSYAATIPGIKVVHLIRDGRDVALSWTKQWFGPTGLLSAAALWQKHVLQYKAWGAKHADQYIEIRYEDLISDPAATLTQLADFAGLEPRKNTSKSGLAAVLKNDGTHDKLGSPVDPNNSAGWTSQLSEDQKRRFEEIAGDTLKTLGYTLSHPENRGVIRPSTRARLVGDIAKSNMSLNAAKRKIRQNIPLILWLGQKLGYSFTRSNSP